MSGDASTSTNFYQGIGLGVNSLCISLLRQMVIILPLAWIFSLVSLILVWWAFPIAEIVALVVNAVLFKKVWAKRIKPLYQE